MSGFLGLAFEGISSFCTIKDIKPFKRQSKQCLLQWKPKEINNAFRKFIHNVWTL